MTLDEIHSAWAEDSKIDISTLEIESIKIPKVHAKYMKIWSNERGLILKLESDLEILKRDKYEFYTQGPSEKHREMGWEWPGTKILKNEVPTYMNGDKDIIKLSLQISYQKEKLNLLDGIIKMLNNRSFQIKNAIDYLKWKQGG